jgi:hypothetical protein
LIDGVLPINGVMAGLVPAIHVFRRRQDVDARHKAGHDGGDVFAWSCYAGFPSATRSPMYRSSMA